MRLSAADLGKLQGKRITNAQKKLGFNNLLTCAARASSKRSLYFRKLDMVENSMENSCHGRGARQGARTGDRPRRHPLTTPADESLTTYVAARIQHPILHA